MASSSSSLRYVVNDGHTGASFVVPLPPDAKVDDLKVCVAPRLARDPASRANFSIQLTITINGVACELNGDDLLAAVCQPNETVTASRAPVSDGAADADADADAAMKAPAAAKATKIKTSSKMFPMTCSVCAAPATKTCTACKPHARGFFAGLRYCSRECQTTDYREHKIVCKKIRAMADAPTPDFTGIGEVRRHDPLLSSFAHHRRLQRTRRPMPRSPYPCSYPIPIPCPYPCSSSWMKNYVFAK